MMSDHPHDCPSPHPMLIAAARWLPLSALLLLSACLLGAVAAGWR